MDEAGEGHIRQVGGNTDFDKRFSLVLFRWIELSEARAQDMCLPEIAFGTEGFLLGAVIDEPDFGAVIAGIANQDKREEGLVGLQVDLAVQLGNERAKLFQKADADLLEVIFAGTGRLIHASVGGAYVLEIVIEAYGPRLRGYLPLRGAEEDAHVRGINLSSARRHGGGLDRMIDDAENDGVARDVDDDAAASKVGDDFVRLGDGGRRKYSERHQE